MCMKFQGNLCGCLVSDSILGYSILTPCYLAGLTSWKELYERRQEEKIGGQDIFYILPLYLDSTTIVDEEILPDYKWNGCVSQC